MLSRSTLSICAGVAGALFVGYCIYFDKKRRSDPNFRKKLKEKRRSGRKSSDVKWPNLKDSEATQQFFIQQIQLGEELLSVGDFENGVKHLARAVTVCAQPKQLLSVLHQTLPPQIFQLLIASLPQTGKSIAEVGISGGEVKIVEDELE